MTTTYLELHRLAAAALSLGVRVVELEAVPHHPAHEVELHAGEVDQALGVDDDRHAVRRELLVGRSPLIRPLEHVGEAGAAAAADADADPGVGRAALVALAPDLVGRGRGDLDLLGRRRGGRRGCGRRRVHGYPFWARFFL